MLNQAQLWQSYQRVITCTECTDSADRGILRDDLFNLPQPGYVGTKYTTGGVLLVGQNPGVSNENYKEQDQRYAEALATLADRPSHTSMMRLQDILTEIIPTWPVQNNYFPLQECNLTLDEIAYCNVVRCRTKGNAAPSKQMTATCISRHFENWLDLLQPGVVICIGKWACDQISPILQKRGIKSCYMNRWRSLPAEDRAANRRDVVACVCGVSPETSGTAPTPAKTTPNKMTASPDTSGATAAVLASSDKKSGTQSPSSAKPSTLNSGAYSELFRKLGFKDIEPRKTLKHPEHPVPSLYFNRKRDGSVYFTGYQRDKPYFSQDLWVFLKPQQKKDDVPSLITVVPHAGKEKEAFASLLQ
jgi:uracil-DNA glycosylase